MVDEVSASPHQGPELLLLIQRFLKAGYLEAGQIVATEQGTPQGGNLSPMLSNIFLHYVLDLWFTQQIKPRLRGKACLIRYADDCVARQCLFKMRVVPRSRSAEAGCKPP